MKSRSVIHALLNHVQTRFRRARAGSVLILVVALLVLMALLGTAFISTARIDRYGAAQNAANTQIDLLMEGVENLVLGAILDDLRDAEGYRAPNRPVAPANYEHHDSPLADPYLAIRVPGVQGGQPSWRSVSWPLIPNGPSAANPYQFDSPGLQAPILLPNSAGTLPMKASYSFRPSHGLFNNEPNWPHLRIFDDTGTTEHTTGNGIPAADADGDGIADAGLWRLPISPVDGITYYVATRIVDNNSAWNGSLAWAPNDGTGNSIPGNSFFPTEIDLQRMLSGAPGAQVAAMTELNTYRTGSAVPQVLASPVADGAPTAQTATPRTDFAFTSLQEAMWSQLGRRLGYPGFKTDTIRYRAVPLSASVELAYRFCLTNPGASPSIFEQGLLRPSYEQLNTYEGNEYTQWFVDNFNYAVTADSPLRAITVARNPVANARPSHSRVQPAAGEPGFRGIWAEGVAHIFGDWVTGADGRAYLCTQAHTSAAANNPVTPSPSFWTPVPWSDQPVKASINTAEFGELWHAFYDVMINNTAAPYMSGEGVESNGTPVQRKMFRSTMRDPSLLNALTLTGHEMIQLRSALAAINAIDLRDSDNDVTSRLIQISPDPAVPATYDVMVYGTERQPYITEVLIDANGYVAFELHNPYLDAPISLAGWHLATVPRRRTDPMPRIPVDVGELGSLIPEIPPGEYVVFYVGNTPSDVLAQMGALDTEPQLLPGATEILDNEIVLLRPRRANGVLTTSMAPENTYNEALLTDLVPVDQIDLTGVNIARLEQASRIVYRRASEDVGGNSAWHFAYPGGYVLTNDIAPAFRHSGMIASEEDPGNLGHPDLYRTTAPPTPPPNNQATYLTLPLQLANLHMGGPRKTIDPISQNEVGGAHLFPYGGFARNGDILQVPFVGGYRIVEPGTVPDDIPALGLLEWNSVTMDIALADDTVATNNWQSADNATTTAMREQVGRFCPVGDPAGGTAAARGDFDPAGGPATYTYRWAMDLFDHVTVQAPHDDYLPDVDPSDVDPDVTPPPATPPYPGDEPAPVANEDPTIANDHIANTPPEATEGKVPVEGLININTASWKVLEALPMVRDGAGNVVTTGGFTNRMMAQAIVNYRDGTTTTAPNGPFQTMYDLYKVPEFRAWQQAILGAEPNDIRGDLSPAGAPTDLVRFDFEERFLLLNQISNLITTRSDSYTCYVVVQGWQDAGTANATLRTQRRLAFIVDRSRIVPTNPQPTVTPVPNN